VCPHSFGPGWGTAAYVLGWIAVGVAFIATVGIPYVYMWYHAPGIDSMPPTVILPAIAALTSAATCGVISFAANITARMQVPMIIVGYIMIGLGLPFALSLIVVYIARLLNGSWPPRSKAPLTYVIIGPLGQASYAAMILGTSAASPGIGSFGVYNKGRFITGNDGNIVEAASILFALVLWGYGAFWISFALVESIHLGLFKGGGIKNPGHDISMWSPIFPIVWFSSQSSNRFTDVLLGSLDFSDSRVWEADACSRLGCFVRSVRFPKLDSNFLYVANF